MKRLLICVLALALLAGCAPASVQEPEDGKLHIVATVFPAYDFARQVFGDTADVKMLLKPGQESHSYDPSAKDIVEISGCDLFVYNGGYSEGAELRPVFVPGRRVRPVGRERAEIRAGGGDLPLDGRGFAS